MYQDYVEKYPNIGKKWDNQQNIQLLNLLLDNGAKRPISSIAYEMGRSENSIILQAVKLLRQELVNVEGILE